MKASSRKNGKMMKFLKYDAIDIAKSTSCLRLNLEMPNKAQYHLQESQKPFSLM